MLEGEECWGCWRGRRGGGAAEVVVPGGDPLATMYRVHKTHRARECASALWACMRWQRPGIGSARLLKDRHQQAAACEPWWSCQRQDLPAHSHSQPAPGALLCKPVPAARPKPANTSATAQAAICYLLDADRLSPQSLSCGHPPTKLPIPWELGAPPRPLCLPAPRLKPAKRAPPAAVKT